jgi:hypothetical protein
MASCRFNSSKNNFGAGLDIKSDNRAFRYFQCGKSQQITDGVTNKKLVVMARMKE